MLTMNTMQYERIRLVLLGLASLVLGAAGLWMLLSGTGWHDKIWGAVGVLFFGVGGVAVLRSATKDRASLKRQIRSPTRIQPFIVPAVLLFTLPWSLKLWFCVPLLLAWALLFPRYEDRRALIAACVLAAAIAVGQAVLFSLALGSGSDLPEGPRKLILQLVFMAVLLLLDVRVLWEVRKRLRPPASAEDIAPR
jgi:hypothetical protein